MRKDYRCLIWYRKRIIFVLSLAFTVWLVKCKRKPTSHDKEQIKEDDHTHTHTHTHTHIYIYIYIYIQDVLTRTHTHGCTHKHTTILMQFPLFINHHHHHVVLQARIALTLSRHFSLSFITSGRSSGLQTVSSHSCCKYVRVGRPAFARPYVGVHKSTSLMSSSLLLHDLHVWFV